MSLPISFSSFFLAADRSAWGAISHGSLAAFSASLMIASITGWHSRWANITAPSITSSDSSLARSEEHTSELQSLMRNSYAVFCLKKKKKYHNQTQINNSKTLVNQKNHHSDIH